MAKESDGGICWVGCDFVGDFKEAISKMAKITQKKAKKILKHGTVHGKALTKKQKGFLGARAGGQPVKRKKKK